jgi:tetratricopeptide (TPR) repeat protein
MSGSIWRRLFGSGGESAGKGGQDTQTTREEANRRGAKEAEEIENRENISNLESHDAEVWFARGNDQYRAGDFVGAIASFDKAIEIKPDDHIAWFGRGIVLGNLGRFEDEIASYDQAIKIKHDFQLSWFNRGIALLNLERFEEAIASYDQAIKIKHDFHEAWLNRGIALDKLGRSEDAVASCDRAIEFKPDLHLSWYSRGIALGKLERYEDAIASYDQAIKIKHDFHLSWSNRGIALLNLERFEEAIASSDQAIKIKHDFHEAWLNRGIALDKLGRSEDAIASCDKAIEFKPDYHDAWINRGAILCDKLQRYEEAIASYDKAIEFKPDYYLAWANRGVALDRLGRFEDAIASYDQAIEIKPDFHLAWYNRGITAGLSRKYNPEAAMILSMQFLASPAVMPNPILTRRGYEGKLLSYQEGLKYCLQDTHPEGWGKLHQSIGDAHYFEGKGKSNSRDYWHKAVVEYKQALITLTAADFPELHLDVLQDLIKPLLGLGQTTEAKEWLLQGLDVLRDLFNTKKSSTQKRQLEFQFASFRQLGVDILVQEGELVTALETAERNKNICLTWLLDALNEHIISPPYNDIKRLLNPTTAIVYWHKSSVALTTFILKHDTPKPIILPTNEVATQLGKLDEWIKNWNQQYQEYRTSKDGEGKKEHIWRNQLPATMKQLGDILDIPAILREINGNTTRSPIQNAIDHLILIPHRDLHRLPLHYLFPDNLTISYLPSAQMGLNLQAFQSRQSLDNLVPRLQPGNESQGGSTSLIKLLSVENPNSEDFEPLRYAEIESAVITSLFESTTRIAANKATKLTVVETLKATSLQPKNTIFHFTGHGMYNFYNPSKSALALSGKDSLTLEDIINISLNSYQLVSLSACETAVTGNKTIDAEYVGLVSAFLSRGVAVVVSTLWTVESISSALLMIEFYRHFVAGVAAAEALKQAQFWLKTVTYAKLAEWYLQRAAELTDDSKSHFQSYLRREATILQQDIGEAKIDPEHSPYTHPYYWAAFTVTG